MNELWQLLFGGSNGGNRQASQAFQSHPAQSSGAGFTGAQSSASALYAQQAQAAAQQAINARYNALVSQYAAFQGPSVESESEPKIENAGIHCGEVLAWRCWRLQSGLLKSAFHETIWAPSEPMQGAISTYGVHAWKTLSSTLQYGLSKERPVFVGQVELWGEIIEHEHGYRAEYAAIKTLDGCLGGNEETLFSLRKRYKVGGCDDLVIDEPPRGLPEQFRPVTPSSYDADVAALRKEFPDWDQAAPRIVVFLQSFGLTQTDIATVNDYASAKHCYEFWESAGRP